MDTLHEMLVADEIFLCGIVLLCGLLAGIVTRLALGGRERKVV